MSDMPDDLKLVPRMATVEMNSAAWKKARDRFGYRGPIFGSPGPAFREIWEAMWDAAPPTRQDIRADTVQEER